MMNTALGSGSISGPRKIFYGWWIVLACFLISIITGAVTFFGFTAFFDPLIREFGWSYTEVSFALSLRGMEMSFLAPAVGFLADRYGSRRLAFWGVLAIGLGFFLLSFTRTLWMFYASITLIAFGAGGCTGVVLTNVVANWFQRRVGLALGILNSGFGASGFLIPLIVWLIDDFGWRTAVVILGFMTWVVCIPLIFIIRNTPEKYGLYRDGVAPDSASAARPGGKDKDDEDVAFLDALKDRAFLFLALSDAARMMAVSAVITHIMPYLAFLQVPRATAGLIASGVTVVSILGRLGFGWLADFFDKRYTLAISLTLMCLGMFALLHVDVPWFMALFLLLFPAGYGGVTSVRGAFIREYFGRAAFGRLIGIVLGVASVGGVIGPTLTGYLFDTTGSYASAWISLGLVSTCAIFLLLSIRRK